MKKLYRSSKDKRVTGVLGGFAEYTNVDSTVVRLLFVLLALMACFPILLFYVICYIVIPVKDTEHVHNHRTHGRNESFNSKKEKTDVSREPNGDSNHTK